MTSPSLVGAQLRRLGHAVTSNLADYVRNRPQARRRLTALLLAGAVPPAVLAGFILSIPEEPIDPAKLQRVVYTPVKLPDLRSQITLSTPVNEPMTRDTPVRDHDTLTSLFARLKIRDPAAFDFVTRDPGARELVIPRKGGFATADLAADGSLNRLSLFYDTPDTAEGRVLEVTRMDDGQSFAVNTSPFAFDVQTALVSGTVLGSPDASFKDLGVPATIVTQMHNAFDFDRDAVTALTAGDRFRLIYETKYAHGNFVRYGRLLAMSFDHAGTTQTWFWFNNDGRGGHFFDASGRIAQRVFMRIPLDVKSVSSEFAPLRRHPITGVVRPHQGTDFRAPWGATVRAAADGEVVFAGVGTGYGNYIRLQHGPEYQTVYAHLSSIAPNVVKGAQVKYGQLIGRVGQTGLATGPHLHYELKVDGVQINPMTADLPDEPDLSPYQLAQMRVRIAPLKAKLNLLSRVQTAQTEANTLSAAQPTH